MEFDNYNIRMAIPEDKGEIERLTREIVKERDEVFEEKRFEWGILRRIYDPLQRHGIFIAEEKNTRKICGIIFGELRIDPFGLSECYIKQIFVEGEYSEKQIEKRLLATIITHLKSIDVKKIKMNLLLDSVKTKSLFTEFKFKPVYTVLELDLNE